MKVLIRIDRKNIKYQDLEFYPWRTYATGMELRIFKITFFEQKWKSSQIAYLFAVIKMMENYAK